MEGGGVEMPGRTLGTHDMIIAPPTQAESRRGRCMGESRSRHSPKSEETKRERERETERGDDVRTAPWRARLSAQETAGQVALEGEEEVLLSGHSRLGSPRPDRRVWGVPNFL